MGPTDTATVLADDRAPGQTPIAPGDVVPVAAPVAIREEVMATAARTVRDWRPEP